MKSDYHGLVEQSEINQSMDENFNSPHDRGQRWKRWDLTQRVQPELQERTTSY
jgi:hypothetical protein